MKATLRHNISQNTKSLHITLNSTKQDHITSHHSTQVIWHKAGARERKLCEKLAPRSWSPVAEDLRCSAWASERLERRARGKGKCVRGSDTVASKKKTRERKRKKEKTKWSAGKGRLAKPVLIAHVGPLREKCAALANVYARRYLQRSRQSSGLHLLNRSLSLR